MPAPSVSSNTTRMLGPYVLGPRVGLGGFAEVFKVQHHQSHEVVAAKVLRKEFVQDSSALEGFEREASMLQSLDLRGIPKLIKKDRLGDRPALIMDFIRGHPLHKFLQEKIEFDKVSSLTAMIRLVASLHAAGILHNDLKPENFMLGSDNTVYLVDFGNATHASDKMSLLGRLFRRRRSISGTPAYMAPELIRGGAPNYRTDVYALGACAHYVLTGQTLIEGSGATSKMRKAVKGKQKSVSERISRLPRDLVQIVDRACSPDPDMRPLDAQSMSHQLQRHFKSGYYRKPTELNSVLNRLKAQEHSSG
ncbi:MAG: serine/threonine protein kinase [Planctomycetota bacterium]|nr:MAG: serine/threonine protein kinase [Planctomycetota bacterium]